MRLKELRKLKGLSQKELADYLGFSQNTISQWESGKREMDASIVTSLADFFGVSADCILGRKSTTKDVPTIKINALDLKMLNKFYRLNDLGKQEAIKRVSELSELPIYQNAAPMPIAAHVDNIPDSDELKMLQQDIDEL